MSLPRLLRSLPELRSWRLSKLKAGRSVGLVPTMGALHQGHLNLVDKSLTQNSSTVVSIFVNPSQFGPQEDLSSYPRTLDTDLQALQRTTDKHTGRESELAVFLPAVDEMYPSGISLDRQEQKGAFVEVVGLSEQLEGAIRPQFFRGVATIVTKLLNAATPDRAYFGQKDIQQSVVVQQLVKDLLIPTEIVVVPTAREPSGLAMSSRNSYLSPEGRERASILYKALLAGSDAFKSLEPTQREVSSDSILSAVHKVLDPFTEPTSSFPVKVEYISLSDRTTLADLKSASRASGGILSGAIRVPNANNGQTRIIDNLIL